MKTAIDQIIEEVLIKEKDAEPNGWLKAGYTLTLDILRRYKHDEERQIKEAYNQGYRDAETDNGFDPSENDVANHENAQIYYDETFNSNPQQNI